MDGSIFHGCTYYKTLFSIPQQVILSTHQNEWYRKSFDTMTDMIAEQSAKCLSHSTLLLSRFRWKQKLLSIVSFLLEICFIISLQSSFVDANVLKCIVLPIDILPVEYCLPQLKRSWNTGPSNKLSRCLMTYSVTTQERIIVYCRNISWHQISFFFLVLSYANFM